MTTNKAKGIRERREGGKVGGKEGTPENKILVNKALETSNYGGQARTR